MARINYVLEGKYKGEKILKGTVLRVTLPEEIGSYPLSKHTVSSYDVINEANVSQFSGWKAVMGISAFGSLGMALGLDGDSRKEYIISIEWINGGKSLILVDYGGYKTFISSMF